MKKILEKGSLFLVLLGTAIFAGWLAHATAVAGEREQIFECSLSSDEMTRWTLATDSTEVCLGMAKGVLYLLDLKSSDQSLQSLENHDWIEKAVAVPLLNEINGQAVQWRFCDVSFDEAINADFVSETNPLSEVERNRNASASNTTEDLGTPRTLQFRFESADGQYALLSVWKALDGAGPIEFQNFVRNQSGSPMTIQYKDVYSGRFLLSTGDNDVTLWRFNRSRCNDGCDPLFNKAVLRDPIKPNFCMESQIEGMCNTVTGTLPFHMLDAGTFGLYYGYCWNFGRMIEETNSNTEKIAVAAKLWNEGALVRNDQEVFAVPAFFFGTYAGDTDAGSNQMKHWFWRHKIPQSLFENDDEPRITMCHGGNENNVRGLFQSFPDVTDYVNVLKIDYDWTVPAGILPQADVETENQWLPNPQKYPNGMRNYSEIQKYVTKEKPMYLSLYFVDTYLGCDIGTKEGRQLQLQALKDRFRPNEDGLWGYDYWRSDFSIEIPYNYDSHEGMLWILDQMIAYDPGFRYEHCSGGGTLKDFTTLERMAWMTTEDTSLPLNHRMCFYACSYMIPPVQMRADLNLGYTSRNCGAITGWPTFDTSNPEYLLYTYRTALFGAMMVCAGPGNDTQMTIAKKHWKLYAEKMRPLLRDTNVYHILEQPNGWDWDDWDGIEFYHDTRQEGVVLLFKENATAPDEKTIRLKGLDPDARYSLEFEDRQNLNAVYSGRELMKNGFAVTGMTEVFDSEIVWVKNLD